jgi:hypothetical protein
MFAAASLLAFAFTTKIRVDIRDGGGHLLEALQAAAEMPGVSAIHVSLARGTDGQQYADSGAAATVDTFLAPRLTWVAVYEPFDRPGGLLLLDQKPDGRWGQLVLAFAESWRAHQWGPGACAGYTTMRNFLNPLGAMMHNWPSEFWAILQSGLTVEPIISLGESWYLTAKSQLCGEDSGHFTCYFLPWSNCNARQTLSRAARAGDRMADAAQSVLTWVESAGATFSGAAQQIWSGDFCFQNDSFVGMEGQGTRDARSGKINGSLVCEQRWSVRARQTPKYTMSARPCRQNELLEQAVGPCRSTLARAASILRRKRFALLLREYTDVASATQRLMQYAVRLSWRMRQLVAAKRSRFQHEFPRWDFSTSRCATLNIRAGDKMSQFWLERHKTAAFFVDLEDFVASGQELLSINATHSSRQMLLLTDDADTVQKALTRTLTSSALQRSRLPLAL